MSRFILISVGLLLVLGCKRAPSDATSTNADNGAIAEEAVPGPKDSLAVKFKRLVPSQFKGQHAEIAMTNHFSKDIKDVNLTLRFFDKNGQELGSEACIISRAGTGSESGVALCRAGETVTERVGFEIPESTSRVGVVVDWIKFRDGTTWDRPTER